MEGGGFWRRGQRGLRIHVQVSGGISVRSVTRVMVIHGEMVADASRRKSSGSCCRWEDRLPGLKA